MKNIPMLFLIFLTLSFAGFSKNHEKSGLLIITKKLSDLKFISDSFIQNKYGLLLLKLKQGGLSMPDTTINEKQDISQQERKNKSPNDYNGLVPAPFFEYAFEKILATMMSIASSENIELPVNNPMLHKRLIEEAMWKNGYSYAKTLHKLAEYGFTPTEFQYVGILLAPVNKLETESQLPTVYSGQELIDVKKIIRIMNNY
jgi:hypothetical protein